MLLDNLWMALKAIRGSKLIQGTIERWVEAELSMEWIKWMVLWLVNIHKLNNIVVMVSKSKWVRQEWVSKRECKTRQIQNHQDKHISKLRQDLNELLASCQERKDQMEQWWEVKVEDTEDNIPLTLEEQLLITPITKEVLLNSAVVVSVHHYTKRGEETQRAIICSWDKEEHLAQKELVLAVVNIQINIFRLALVACTRGTRLRYLVEQKLQMIVSSGAV